MNPEMNPEMSPNTHSHPTEYYKGYMIVKFGAADWRVLKGTRVIHESVLLSNCTAWIDGLKQCTVPFLSGRPERETVISADDILNLRIALETVESFDLFLETV